MVARTTGLFLQSATQGREGSAAPHGLRGATGVEGPRLVSSQRQQVALLPTPHPGWRQQGHSALAGQLWPRVTPTPCRTQL